MIRKNITISNSLGLHARPAGVFAKSCASYPCKVTFIKDGKEYNAKSIIHVLSACVKCGTGIELVCDGENEEQALSELVALVESGLPE